MQPSHLDRCYAYSRPASSLQELSKKMKYSQFLKILEENLPVVDGHPLVKNQDLLAKLHSLNIKRIEKEHQYSKIHRLFHKIFQFLSGHGFRTKAERGEAIEKEVNRIVMQQILVADLKGYLENEESPLDETLLDRFEQLTSLEANKVLLNLAFAPKSGKKIEFLIKIPKVKRENFLIQQVLSNSFEPLAQFLERSNLNQVKSLLLDSETTYIVFKNLKGSQLPDSDFVYLIKAALISYLLDLKSENLQGVLFDIAKWQPVHYLKIFNLQNFSKEQLITLAQTAETLHLKKLAEQISQSSS